MKLSINANYLRKALGGVKRTPEECVKLAYEAGFRVIDYSPEYLADSWEREAHAVRAAADKYGVKIEQTHAPMNRYSRVPHDEFLPFHDRCVEAAKIMGCDHIVFHADEYFMPECGPYDPVLALKESCEVIAPHVEKSIKYGINIGIENVFEDGYRCPANCRSRCCSTVEELIAAIDYFADPHVGCCWDFGHARVAFGQVGMTEALKTLGSRVICTHTHDNHGADAHQPPYHGDVDWTAQMKTMRDFGYKGNLTFEMVYGTMPDELLPEFLMGLIHTGEHMLKIFNEK